MRWREALEFKIEGDELNMKASRFHAINKQIKIKMIFHKMHKLLKKEKQQTQQLHINLQKKYYLQEYFTNLRFQSRISIRMEPVMLRNAFQRFIYQVREQQREIA